MIDKTAESCILGGEKRAGNFWRFGEKPYLCIRNRGYDPGGDLKEDIERLTIDKNKSSTKAKRETIPESTTEPSGAVGKGPSGRRRPAVKDGKNKEEYTTTKSLILAQDER